MKGYIIDSNLKGVFPIDIRSDMDYKDIYKYLHTDVKRVSAFDVVRVRGTNDLIYVDDEGLLTRENYMFVFDHLDKHHLFGNGLILGTDTEGESVTPEMSLNWYRDKIKFSEDLVLCEDYLVPPVFVPIK